MKKVKMKIDLSNFSGWVTYEKGEIVATYEKENFYRYYDQEEIRVLNERYLTIIKEYAKENDRLQQKIDKAIEYIKDLYDVRFTDKDKRKLLEILGDKE